MKKLLLCLPLLGFLHCGGPGNSGLVIDQSQELADVHSGSEKILKDRTEAKVKADQTTIDSIVYARRALANGQCPDCYDHQNCWAVWNSDQMIANEDGLDSTRPSSVPCDEYQDAEWCTKGKKRLSVWKDQCGKIYDQLINLYRTTITPAQ